MIEACLLSEAFKIIEMCLNIKKIYKNSKCKINKNGV